MEKPGIKVDVLSKEYEPGVFELIYEEPVTSWVELEKRLGEKPTFSVTDFLPGLSGRGANDIHAIYMDLEGDRILRWWEKMFSDYKVHSCHRRRRKVNILELHCPRVEGAVATWHFGMEDGSSREIELSVAGIGMGGKTKCLVKLSRDLTAMGKCIGLKCGAVCEDIVYSMKGSVGFRCNIIDLDFDDLETYEIRGENDVCGGVPKTGYATMVLVKRFDFRDTPDQVMDNSILFEKGRKYAMKAALNVMGINLGLRVTYKSTGTTGIDYRFPGGNRYLGYATEKDSLGVYWWVKNWD